MNNKNTITAAKAAEDFYKARNKALLSKINHTLRARSDDLLNFDDIKDIVKPRGAFYRGMETVPVKLIVGSEGRFKDFDRNFLPRSDFLKARWESVDRANISDVPLPAIELYEIGGVYFVRDGNHRGSVARSTGIEEIDAEVTSLTSEIKIDPSMATDDIKKAVILYEKKQFYDKTHFLSLTGDDRLLFSSPGRYDVIYQHIEGHKYFLNQNIKEEIEIRVAIVSWYRNIYRPLVKVIRNKKLISFFEGQTPSDLYIWIVKYWDFAKKKRGQHYSPQAAARDFARKYGKRSGFFHLWDFFTKR
jgi:hypothetical protein